MAKISILFVFAAALMASAAPVEKRIAQTIADSTALWEKACLAAGGADKCNPISQTAFTSLLAAGGNCDQQDAADQMIDLAKTLNNDPDMIRLAQIFVQQPRNAPDSLQVPYCQTAPKNAELNGFFHCQFAGSDFTKFSGDQTGNLPLGLTAVNPPGSCPAKTDGPVPDGVQLNTLVQSPGTPEGGSGGSAATASSNSTTASASSNSTAASSTVDNSSSGSAVGAGDAVSASASQASAATAISSAVQTSSTSTTTSGTSSSTSGFALANGQDAIALNNKFAGLTASSSCTDGEQACVGGAFAQCVGGKFATTACSGGTQCFALPLVNSRGTSITCTTQADADARIAATGATA